MRRLLIVAAVVLAGGGVSAQGTEATLFAGWFAGSELGFRAEGGITDDATPDAGAGGGIAVDIPSPQNTTLQLYYAFRPTQLHPDDFPEFGDVDLNVHYMQIGGTYRWKGRTTFEPFIGLTVGGTLFDSEVSGSSMYFSGSAFGGFQVAPLSPVSLRLEARWFASALSTGGVISCSNAGICVGSFNGNAYYDFALTAGATYRFGR